jgi:hypothetical protein
MGPTIHGFKIGGPGCHPSVLDSDRDLGFLLAATLLASSPAPSTTDAFRWVRAGPAGRPGSSRLAPGAGLCVAWARRVASVPGKFAFKLRDHLRRRVECSHLLEVNGEDEAHLLSTGG